MLGTGAGGQRGWRLGVVSRVGGGEEAGWMVGGAGLPKIEVCAGRTSGMCVGSEKL